jgi:hypothetical protein
MKTRTQKKAEGEFGLDMIVYYEAETMTEAASGWAGAGRDRLVSSWPEGGEHAVEVVDDEVEDAMEKEKRAQIPLISGRRQGSIANTRRYSKSYRNSPRWGSFYFSPATGESSSAGGRPYAATPKVFTSE